MRDNPTNEWIGLVILMLIEVCLGGTVIFLMRRRRGFEPAWSWFRAAGTYALLMVIAGIVGAFPGVIAKLLLVLILYSGLKYYADLNFGKTLAMGVAIFLVMLPCIALLNMVLDVDLVKAWGLFQP